VGSDVLICFDEAASARAAPLRPCPAAHVGFCEVLSEPGICSPVRIPACCNTWSVFSVLAGHQQLAQRRQGGFLLVQ
jgi:hypothetical protein